MSLLATIETDIVTGWQDIEAFFANLSADEKALIADVDAVVLKLQNAINSPGAIVIEDLIPDSIGTTAAAILNKLLAGILAGLTYLQGLSTTTGVSAQAVISGDAPTAALNNPNAVAQTAITILAGASASQVSNSLLSYGNQVFTAIAPPGTNLTVDKINLIRSLNKQVTTKAA